MRRVAKFFHLLGFALFLGSVLVHVVVSHSAGAPGAPDFIFARHEILLVTQGLTLPGLGLAIVSGMWMAFASGWPKPGGWIAIHASLAAAVAVIAATIVAPAGRLLAQAPAFDAIPAALARESLFGALSIVLILAAVAVAVWRPRWGRADK